MHKAHDKVTPAADPRVPADCRGRVFTVVKVNPKKTKCSADDGGRGLNFPHDMLVPATEENLAASKTAGSRPFEPTEFVHFSVGEVVTLKTGWREWDTEMPLVVTGGRDKVNVAPLGGDNDRYLRIPRDGLVKRDAGWLAEALVS